MREIPALAKLPALRELHFADPGWGPAPVAMLANYATAVLAALPRLEVRNILRVLSVALIVACPGDSSGLPGAWALLLRTCAL